MKNRILKKNLPLKVWSTPAANGNRVEAELLVKSGDYFFGFRTLKPRWFGDIRLNKFPVFVFHNKEDNRFSIWQDGYMRDIDWDYTNRRNEKIVDKEFEELFV